MRKILLGSAAVAALSFATTGEALAQGAEFNLGLGGYFEFYGLYVDQEDDPAGANPANNPADVGFQEREFDFKREAEVNFTGDITLDNGLTVGADIQLEAESEGSDQIDESFIFFQGDWGRVNLGSENGAGYLLSGFNNPSVWGSLDSADPNYRPINLPSGISNRTSYVSYSPQFDTDSEKITYLTPTFQGFRAGISYSPENCEERQGGNAGCTGTFGRSGTNDAGQHEHAVNLGVRYDGEFSGVRIRAGGYYLHADLESETTPGVSARTNLVNGAEAIRYADEDAEQWGINGRLTYAGFTFGGAYFQDELENSISDLEAWSLALTYNTGPWTAGISWMDQQVDYDFERGDDELTRLTFGGVYNVGPGVSFNGTVSWWDFSLDEDAALQGRRTGTTQVVGNGNDSWVISLGTRVNF